MKKITVFFLLAFICCFATLSAKNKTNINKNDVKLETKSVTVNSTDYSAELSIIINIDDETSVMDSNLRIKLISTKKNEKVCEVVRITNGASIYVGKKGEEPTEFDFEGGYRRWYTSSDRCACEAIYDIDIDCLFESEKIRVLTDNSYVDINFKNAKRELKNFYDKTYSHADETYKQKTNPIHNF